MYLDFFILLLNTKQIFVMENWKFYLSYVLTKKVKWVQYLILIAFDKFHTFKCTFIVTL